MIEGGVISFVRADHIGRPVFATNTAGTKVWSATYQPFGGVHVSTGTLPTNRFPGQWFQSESGLHQNWMRDYDPTTGRYLQADPLGLIDGASVYGYAGQSPMMNMDPSGQCFGPWAIACAAAAWGAVSVYIGWLLDPDCYTWQEGLRDFTVGFAFGGFGAGWNAAGKGAGSAWSAASGVWGAEANAGLSGLKTATGVVVNGFTRHGLNRAIGNGFERAGTSWPAIRDALTNPTKVKTGLDQFGRVYQTFTGASARVTVNPSTGKIVSVNPLGRLGVRGGGF